VDSLWAMKSEGVGLIVPAILVSKISNLRAPDLPTLRTDRRTDDMRSQDRALHYSASRGKDKKLHFLRNYTRPIRQAERKILN